MVYYTLWSRLHPASLDLESIFRKYENIGHFDKFSFVYAHKCYLALFRTFFRPEDPYIQTPGLFSISEAYIALYLKDIKFRGVLIFAVRKIAKIWLRENWIPRK